MSVPIATAGPLGLPKLDLLPEQVRVEVVECSSPSCVEVHRLHLVPVQTIHHLKDLEKTYHHFLIDLQSPHLQNGLKNLYKPNSLDSKNELLLLSVHTEPTTPESHLAGFQDQNANPAKDLSLAKGQKSVKTDMHMVVQHSKQVRSPKKEPKTN